MRFVVFFVVISEIEDELFVDDMYFGGISDDKVQAEQLAKMIINDGNIHGAIVPKIIPMTDFDKCIEIARKYFQCMRNEIYDMELKKKKKGKK